MSQSFFLILRQTPAGERAFEITGSEAEKMLKAGEAERLPDGVLREVKKATYARKDMSADDEADEVKAPAKKKTVSSKSKD